jgi:hypothetical protein
MVSESGVSMVRGMVGSAGGYWARVLEGATIQHSFSSTLRRTVG